MLDHYGIDETNPLSSLDRFIDGSKDWLFGHLGMTLRITLKTSIQIIPIILISLCCIFLFPAMFSYRRKKPLKSDGTKNMTDERADSRLND
jgi:hypothetical protein